MAKPKKSTKVESKKEVVDKSDIVKVLEKLTGETIDLRGNLGSSYTRVPFSEMKKKGYTIGIDVAKGEECVAVIAVQGQSKFQAVLMKDGKVTENDPKEKFTVVQRYSVKKEAPATPPAKEDSEE